jgi:septum formation protein
MIRIILASKSPRRRELLSKILPSFEIIAEETDETLKNGIHPRDGVRILAERKGLAVLKSEKINKVGDIIQNNGVKNREVDNYLLKLLEDCKVGGGNMVISSDTLVEIDGEALGKPVSEQNAVEMLMRLSGKAHRVHTGISVLYNGKIYSDTASSTVYFKKITEKDAWDYVKTGEPMDKAGSYAIQGIGVGLVDRYEGDFDTIVGLSLRLTRKLITEALIND